MKYPPRGLRVLHDTFTDTNGTTLDNHRPEQGGAWVPEAGAGVLEIQSNRVRNTASTGGHRYYNKRKVPLVGFDMSARFYWSGWVWMFGNIGFNAPTGPMNATNELTWGYNTDASQWILGLQNQIRWVVSAPSQGVWLRLIVHPDLTYSAATAPPAEVPEWVWWIRHGHPAAGWYGNDGWGNQPLYHLTLLPYRFAARTMAYPKISLGKFAGGNFWELDDLTIHSDVSTSRRNQLIRTKRTGLWTPKRTVIGR